HELGGADTIRHRRVEGAEARLEPVDPAVRLEQTEVLELGLERHRAPEAELLNGRDRRGADMGPDVHELEPRPAERVEHGERALEMPGLLPLRLREAVAARLLPNGQQVARSAPLDGHHRRQLARLLDEPGAIALCAPLRAPHQVRTASPDETADPLPDHDSHAPLPLLTWITGIGTVPARLVVQPQ